MKQKREQEVRRHSNVKLFLECQVIFYYVLLIVLKNYSWVLFVASFSTQLLS